MVHSVIEVSSLQRMEALGRKQRWGGLAESMADESSVLVGRLWSMRSYHVVLSRGSRPTRRLIRAACLCRLWSAPMSPLHLGSSGAQNSSNDPDTM